MRVQVVALLLAAASTVCSCRPETVAKSSFRGTLSQALLLVDQTFHVSVFGEIVDPIPSGISIEFDPLSTAAEVLATIVAQCPRYVLVKQDEVYIVAQKDLFVDPANPMNEVVRDFYTYDSLTMFKLSFTSAVGKAQQGMQGFGGVLSGPTLPDSLSVPLKVEELHNQTAREILVHVADEAGNLFSILILPSPHPHEQMIALTSLQAWEIAGGPGVMTYKSMIRGHPASSHWAVTK